MKSWKSNYAALLIAEVLATIGFALSTPAIPLFLAEDIGVKDAQTLKLWVGIMASSYAIGLAVFAPIWGHLADLYSRRAMLLRAMFGGVAVNLLMAFVNAPWQLMALRVISGCLFGTVTAATILTVGITPAAHLGFALGILQTGIAVGNALGPLFGGVVSDFLGRRSAFMGTSLILAVSGLIVLKFVEDYKQAGEKREKRKLRLLPDIRPVIHSPLIISLLFVSFSIQAANNTINPMLPLFIKDLLLRGIDNTGEAAQYIGSTTGLVLGIGAAATAIAAVLAGKFCAGFGYWRTIIFCLSLGAVLQIPQTMVTNVAQLTVFRALALFFIGGTVPVLQTLLAASTEKKQQGIVFGLNSSISQIGGAVGPMIGSAVAMLSYEAVFLATAALLGICTFITIWRRRYAAQQ